VAVLCGFTPTARILIDAGGDVARDRKEPLGLARQEKDPVTYWLKVWLPSRGGDGSRISVRSVQLA
jgi:hypothetical protein